MVTHHSIDKPTGDMTDFDIRHTARVHFLNPNGLLSVEKQIVPDSNLDYIIAHPPHRALGEIGWVNFIRELVIPVTDTKDNQALPKIVSTETAGTTYVATNWERGGIYSFSSMEELLEAPSLPIYTAEMLARHTKGQSQSSRVVATSLWGELMKKAPFFDHNSPNENPTERTERLTTRLLEQEPRLGPRFVVRGIVDEETIIWPEAEAPTPVKTLRYGYDALLASALSNISFKHPYYDPQTGESISKPRLQTTTDGKTIRLPGVPVMKSTWKIKEIVNVRIHETGIEIDITHDSDEEEIRQKLAQTVTDLRASREKTEQHLSSGRSTESNKFLRKNRD